MNRESMKHWIDRHKSSLTLLAVSCASILFYCILARLTPLHQILSKLYSGIRPFLYGAIIAYLLRPCCNVVSKLLCKWKFMRKHQRLEKTLSVGIAMTFGISCIVLLGVAIIPSLVDSLSSIINTLPEAMNKFFAQADEILAERPELYERMNEFYVSSKKWITESVVPNVGSITTYLGDKISSIFTFTADIFIGMVAAVYMLADKTKIRRNMLKIVNSLPNPKAKQLIIEESRFADKTFSRYVVGTIADALIVGIVTYIYCIATGTPSALLISVICATTNIIPIIGPFIGAIPSAFIVLTYAPDKFIMFCIFVLILQQIDGHILVPKILGGAVGISGLTALMAITIGGRLFGTIGMIIGVPAATILIDTYNRIYNKAPLSSEEACYEETS